MTAQLTIPDDALLGAMRGDRDVDDICRAAGASRDDFAAARLAFLERRLPPTNAQLTAGVGGRVEILRDTIGIPHIYAGSTTDLYFGAGFAMAQDRLWQMDRLRRRALGRQAEVLGPEYVASDLQHHLVGIPEMATAEAEQLDDGTRQIVAALVAGINRQIDAAGRELPVEFAILDYEPEPFTVRDAIAILRGIWWSLNGRLDYLVASEAAAQALVSEDLLLAFLTPEASEERIVPPGSPYYGAGLPLDRPRRAVAGMGMAPLLGSNNWAVAGSRTASGQPLLCSDPHQPYWLPSSWWEYALHGPEDDVAGAGHPGVPGFWWGSNGQIAWGLTNNGASTRDLYVEEVHPDDASRYREGGGWERFVEQEITIGVRGEEPSRFTRRSTVRGPIMNEVLPSVADGGDPPLSLRWVGQEHLDDIRACVGISRARDWPSFRAALRDWSVPIFNFVYADRAGTIGYQCGGRIPIRGRIKPGFREANNPADAWQGTIPFDALPRMENPPRGYVSSANNAAAPDDYPYALHGAFAAGYRALRIGETLQATAAFDAAQGRALQNDVKGVRAATLCPPIVRRLESSEDPNVRLLVDVLRDWDYTYTLDSSGPAVFEMLMRAWQLRVAAERFPDRLVPLVAASGSMAARLIEHDTDDLGWFAGDVETAFAQTANEAVAILRDRFGPDRAGWRWGEIHHAHVTHVLSNPDTADLFDVGPAAIAGGADTVCNVGAGVPPDFAANGGVEYRLLVDFATPDRIWAIQNVGNSGQPGSPHYADQFHPWIAGAYHEVPLSRSAVAAAAVGTTTLEPD